MNVFPKLFVIVIFISMNMTMTAFASTNDKWPHTKGKVVAVDVENSIVTIKNAKNQQMKFQIVPTSEIKIQKHGLLKFDRDAALKDLNIGQRIAVTYYGSRETKVARDIHILFDTNAMNVPSLMWLLMARAQAASHRK